MESTSKVSTMMYEWIRPTANVFDLNINTVQIYTEITDSRFFSRS